jgi:putative membrane protein
MVKENFWFKMIYMLSGVLSMAVAFLILGPSPEGIEGAIDVSSLPLVNALLNLTTTILLIIGYVLIKLKKREMHRSVMLTAFFSSALFLVSYVIYHWFKSGPKAYTGEWISVYYPILVTHIILAMIILPLAMMIHLPRPQYLRAEVLELKKLLPGLPRQTVYRSSLTKNILFSSLIII